MKVQHKNSQQNEISHSIVWILLLIATGVVLLTSCTKDNTHTLGFSGPEGKETLVRLTLNAPNNNTSLASTRSQTESECEITEVLVLTFEDGIYKYTSGGTITGTTSSTTTFETILNSSKSVVKLYILANVNDAIANAELRPGEDESSIKRKLILHFTNAGIASGLPMFGEYTISDGLSAEAEHTINGIKMLRSVARVDIINNVEDFKLASIQAFRVNDRIQLIPNYLTDPTDPEVTSPSVPNGARMVIQTQSLEITGNSFTSGFYLPESKAPDANALATQATCIVVGGYFQNSNIVTYYRIDFQTDPVGEILRNNCYTFTITGVNLAGKDTAEEAAANLATGIISTTQNWEETQDNMIFDGDNYFGVSSRQITLKYRAGTDMYIDVETSLDNYGLLWADANGETEGETAAPTIRNSYFEAEITDDGKRIHITALSDNKTTTPRISYMVIQANRWEIEIEIKQSDIRHQSMAQVEILSFGLGIGGFGGTYPGRLNNGNAAGVRGLLQNTDNFSPTGIVAVGNIAFDYNSTTDKTDVLRQYLNMFDVINISYGSSISSDQATIILDWLAASKHRVLLVSRDGATTNTNMITAICGGTSMWASGSGKFLPAALSNDNDYFLNSGPFGALRPEDSYYTFSPNDGVWQGIKPTDSFADSLAPLLVTEAGQYIISVDINRRIVLCGDAGLYQVHSGLDVSGTTTSARAKLMANLWAWIIEEIVLPGKMM